MTTPPAATAALVVVSVSLSMIAIAMNSAFKLLALAPGHSIIGSFHPWTLLTANLIDTNVAKLAVLSALTFFLGSRAEAPAGPHPADRVTRTVLVSLTLAGVLVAVAGLLGFVATGEEPYLYSYRAGVAPLTAILAVLAAEAHGDAPVSPLVPWLPFSVLPLLTILLTVLFSAATGAAAAAAGGSPSDVALTATSVFTSWVLLRFFVRHGDGGVGDAREDFEFLLLAPGPLRVALRPLVKLGSAVFLPAVRRIAAATVGGGAGPTGAGVGAAAALNGGLPTVSPLAGSAGGGSGPAVAVPGVAVYGSTASSLLPLSRAHQGLELHAHLQGTGLGSASASAAAGADPVAERRREKALRALDKRLAELKAKIRTAPPGAGAAFASTLPAAPAAPVAAGATGGDGAS